MAYHNARHLAIEETPGSAHRCKSRERYARFRGVQVELTRMDPATLAALVATFLLQQRAGPGGERPESAVDAAIARQAKFAELSKGIVLCYHESARNPRGEVLQRPWKRQAEHRADDSALVLITFYGALTGREYEMRVALLARNDSKQVRTAVQADNAPFNPNRRCALDSWTQL